MIEIFLGLFVSLGIAIYAYTKGSLSKSGLVSAAIYGASLYFFGGIIFLLIMLCFFSSSSLLSKYKHGEKQPLEVIHEKGDRRDYTQVIANGLPSFIFAGLFYVTQNHGFILGFATCLAAANADTWASELGVLSQNKPVSILTGKSVSNGMSGGVTTLGTLASFLGGLFIAIVFISFSYFAYPELSNEIWILLFLCTFGGFLGSIIDSVLGASAQGIYKDMENRFTEKRYSSSEENTLVRGFKVINNNLVNLLSGTISATLVVLIYFLVI
ncbi:DUF92 domain-containing protein [Alkalicella caledoniensis]|uniref:DUF92 domain-containing protein n=1 Tax=Alkalicella caledoniensis TaxID=2731377 RepID=A0A7G9W7H8_ALKCA|nr:DUF92 domain-containing protein [Alkalicella caledoniensis]QNO14640.1 DUF92 domain-containing protein [Alkalicella caledoniensis]